MVIRWVPGYEGSVGERGFIIIQAIEELRLGGAWWRQRFGADSGRGPRGQLVVGGSGQSLLGRRIGWFQTLWEHREDVIRYLKLFGALATKSATFCTLYLGLNHLMPFLKLRSLFSFLLVCVIILLFDHDTHVNLQRASWLNNGQVKKMCVAG